MKYSNKLSSEKTKPKQPSIGCYAISLKNSAMVVSSFTRYRLLQICILQGQLETEWNSWISTSIEKSTWGTSYKGISAHACHMTIIKLLCEWKLACAIAWETYYCDFCNQKQLTKIYSKSCSSCTNTIITINQDNKHPLKVNTPWI